ncbi:MAG: hypothetical protein FWF67_06445 [Fibromonadales bacterium]|nr:hypothetical protein [Fibromonadales bacterium]
MNKILAPFACIMAAAMLSACGSQDDATPTTPAWPDYPNLGYINRDLEPNDSENDARPIPTNDIIQGIKILGNIENRMESASGKTIYVLDEDYYKIDLNWGDSISITVSNATNIQASFNVKFYGPCERPGLGCAPHTDRVVDKQNLSFQEKIQSGEYPTNDFTGKVTFFIKVSNAIDTSQPNASFYNKIPYAINIRLLSQSR